MRIEALLLPALFSFNAFASTFDNAILGAAFAVPVGTSQCISRELAAQAPQTIGKILTYSGLFFKGEAQGNEIVRSVAEIWLVTDRPLGGVNGTVFLLHFSAVENEEFERREENPPVMFTKKMDSNAKLFVKDTGELEFTLDLTPCKLYIGS